MASFSVSDLTPAEKEQLRALRKRKAELMEEIEAIRDELGAVNAELETLYYVEEDSKPRHKLLFNGRKKFNVEPARGIEYLVDRGLLEHTPDAVGEYLFRGEGLSKAAIGDYLGANDAFNISVLENFIARHDVAQMFLVDALRLFLWSFRLPGESQKIDRIMEKFSAHYCHLNPGAFPSPDTCFQLAYASIMLNTLLHNPSVKDRPSLERFVAMNREIVDASVSHETLANIYESIRSQAFKIPDDDVGRLSELFLNPEREGWLCKQSASQFLAGGPLSWKRRWFVLSEACLYYFETTTDREPRGIIPLQNVGVRRVENASRPFMFEIYSLSDERIKACKTETDGRMREGRHSVYRMCASSEEDMRVWIEHIAAAITHYPARPRSTH